MEVVKTFGAVVDEVTNPGVELPSGKPNQDGACGWSVSEIAYVPRELNYQTLPTRSKLRK